MAATRSTKCPVCGKQHEFLLADPMVNMAGGVDYEFTCPKNAKPGTINFGGSNEWWKTVERGPEDRSS